MFRGGGVEGGEGGIRNKGEVEGYLEGREERERGGWSLMRGESDWGMVRVGSMIDVDRGMDRGIGMEVKNRMGRYMIREIREVGGMGES